MRWSPRTTASRHSFRISMWRARITGTGSTQRVAPTGFSSSGGWPLPRPSPYHTGPLTAPAKTASPRRTLPVSCMAGLPGAHGLLAEVELALLLALHHQGVGDQLGDAGDLDLGGPELAHRRERGPVDGAHGRQLVHPVPLVDEAHRVAARQAAAEPDLHVLLGAEAGAPAAAEGLLADGVLRHLEEVPHHALQDVARLREHPHRARRVAGVVEGDAPPVVPAGIELELAVPDEVGGELHDEIGRASCRERV